MKFWFSKGEKQGGGDQSPLFHVTHVKAGSTWLYNIFHDAYGARLAPRVGGAIEGIQARPGEIHSAVFSDYESYLRISGAADAKCFYVMRDIRDTLVSLYFSLRYSHQENPRVRKVRPQLQGMTDSEGVLHVFKTSHRLIVESQASWVRSGKPVYRYEDLFNSGGLLLLEVLDDIEFEYDRHRLEEAIKQRTFAKEFKREPGTVDIHSHGRSGLPGGWRDHLSKELDEFIGDALDEHIKLTGYDA